MNKINYYFNLTLSRILKYLSSFLVVFGVVKSKQKRAIPLNYLCYYSGKKTFVDQIVSVKSFLKNVGVPNKILICSDGTYKKRHKDILTSIHPVIEIIEFDVILAELKQILPTFIVEGNHPMNKKLLVEIYISNLKLPLIYSDSDIVYFENGIRLLDILANRTKSVYYLRDFFDNSDTRILREEENTIRQFPINAGFFILNRVLNWDIYLKRLESITFDYFTEQTIINLVFRNGPVVCLDPELFIMEVNDAHLTKDIYKNKSIVLRHYIGYVRTKMRFLYLKYLFS